MMNPIGKIVPKKTLDIKKSKIGVGFECLDRKMWEDVEEVYEAAAELGAKYARVQTGWGRTETSEGVYDFAWLDRIVDKLLAAGCQPWFNIGYGHVLYTDAVELDACGWVPLYSQKARDAWCAYVVALTEHFANRITHYEVWNEPDNRNFWRPNKANQQEYVDLVRITSQAIKEIQPNAKIIAGQCGLNLWDAPKIMKYIEYGLLDLIDVFSFHRYRVMPEIETPQWISKFKNMLDKYATHPIELWQGEGGFPSVTSITEALAGVPVDEEIQAKLLLRSILTDLYNNTDYTSYFTMSDFKYYYNNGFIDKPNFFGLLTTDYPPRKKTSFNAFQNVCSLFDSETYLDNEIIATMETCDSLATQDRYSFHEKITASNVVSFQRKEKPMIVWWHKTSGLAKHGDYPINIIVWSKDKFFENPVLIDMLTGEVFAVNEEYEKPDFRMKAHDVPLKDYPMILADKSSIEDIMTTL